MLVVEFEWDDSNVLHIARHGLDMEEVSGILRSRITVIKNKRAGSGEYKLIGRATGGHPGHRRRGSNGGRRSLAPDHGQEEQRCRSAPL